jgi:hypothetical protein
VGQRAAKRSAHYVVRIEKYREAWATCAQRMNMVGLPGNFDPSFLCGRTLDLVCFTAHQVNLHFSDGCLISVEGNMSLDDGESLRLPDVLSLAYLLINQEIDGALCPGAGTLSLSFKNRKTLHIHDSNRQFESYVVSVKGGTVVRV